MSKNIKMCNSNCIKQKKCTSKSGLTFSFCRLCTLALSWHRAYWTHCWRRSTSIWPLLSLLKLGFTIKYFSWQVEYFIRKYSFHFQKFLHGMCEYYLEGDGTSPHTASMLAQLADVETTLQNAMHNLLVWENIINFTNWLTVKCFTVQLLARIGQTQHSPT